MEKVKQQNTHTSMNNINRVNTAKNTGIIRLNTVISESDTGNPLYIKGVYPIPLPESNYAIKGRNISCNVPYLYAAENRFKGVQINGHPYLKTPSILNVTRCYKMIQSDPCFRHVYGIFITI